MTQTSAIVVVVDRLGAGYLGPYGNTWLETPALNRLASQSMIWEHAFADCPTLEAFYRAAGCGRHFLSSLASDSEQQREGEALAEQGLRAVHGSAGASPSPGASPFPGASPSHSSGKFLTEQLGDRGVQTILVADEPLILTLPMAAQFSQRLVIPAAEVHRLAESFDETQMAQTFAAAIDGFPQLQPPFLLWLHVRGMSGPWDAPREFRERFADEEDPLPPDFVAPPDKILPHNTDPDEILGVTHAIAGQITLLDLCLDTLLASVDGSPWHDQTLVLFTSARGYPLGEHGALGASGDGLHEEVLHIPLMIRLPGRRHAMRRFQTLVHTPDLFSTLASWFGWNEADGDRDGMNLLRLAEAPAPSPRECVISAFGNHRSLRTPSWFLRKEEPGPPRLYAKPDDRWEVNEVANRCGHLVDSGMQALEAFEQLAVAGRGGEFPRLPPLLLDAAE